VISMKSLLQRLAESEALLAPYAVPHIGTLGRAAEDTEDETRFPFQRDRDRIIHTQSFRRLKGKTQVFVTGQGDHYRTRLTHTMEVAQIGRDIARTLSLNEDLAECIALAHDLGHPPFGHTGEEALNSWMKQFGSSFEHNRQSHRIVTMLEIRTTAYVGLNLNTEVLEGLLKHRTSHDTPQENLSRSPSLEAQLVNLSDEIAYTGHDCDDGLNAKLFTLSDILKVPLAYEAHEISKARSTSLRGALIHMLVSDLYESSEKRLQSVESLDDVYSATTPLIAFSQAMEQNLKELREFLWKHMYLHPEVLAKSTYGKEVVRSLCTHLHEHPSAKVLSFQENSHGALEEAVKDYVSGMTDRYAISQAEELGLL
jgi:dGTPase